MTTAVSPVPVMTSADAALLEVEVHANVLALIEAYTKAVGTSMPWATLLAAASATPLGHELLSIRVAPGIRVTSVVRDAVSDLLSLGLVETGPAGLHITDSGCDMVRGWNGEYRRRLEAAETLLRSPMDLIPGA
ncbi:MULTISPECIES: hypothetical protein [unclassified Nocardioides]|uniref:hypothetical protein n=1 Tax=unclassified Nocardioides TaxID=2615069 RepID=UPI003611A19B